MNDGNTDDRIEARIALRNQRRALNLLKFEIEDSDASPSVIVAKTAEIDTLIDNIQAQLEILDTVPTIVPPTVAQARELAAAAENIARVVAANATVQQILDAAKQIAESYESGALA